MDDALRSHLYYGNTVQQWAVALGIALCSWFLGKLLYWLSSQVLRRFTQRTSSRLDDILLHALEGPVVVLITILGFLVAYEQLQIPARPDRWIRNAFHAATAISITWMVVRILDAALKEYLVPYAQQSDSRLDDHLVPVVRKATRGALWTLGIIVALNNAGYDVGALLAGIGIGGLALAMAAKDTVANIFGGITVFADKPFRLGDRVRLEGYDGHVLEVGIRSTRIRTLEGPVVVVPNHKFTDSLLENVTAEHARRVRHELGLVYETPAEKMEEALAILKAIVEDHQDVLEPEHLLSFNAFKEYSLNILFIYYIRKSADIFATQTKIHLEVLRRFRTADLHFAYPTAVELQGEFKRPY